jgi:hypothetical protein
MIGNELLKTAQTYLNPCLVKLFNAVFTSGIYPQIWSEGYITPIFKANKFISNAGMNNSIKCFMEVHKAHK